ncbi:MAG: DUF4184 family protein [Candidatus Obscuribacterales bacterium]|nr:DUF4184 family protein [Candidatus Obscuribacterales bacterium]
MPFTFSHPAAVLPLRKYCPRYLNLVALMAGSIAPDLGYYLHNWHWSISGHSFLGSLSFDLPAGLMIVALFYLSIRPIARLLAHPHREALSSAFPVLSLPGLKSISIATVSVLLGAWTHIIWDGFTHANGWCVRQFSAMTPTLFSISDYRITLWHLLQHGSTIFGLIVLAQAYNRYVHSKRFLRVKSLLGEKTRSAIWFLLLALPAVLAVQQNLHHLQKGLSLPRLDNFIYNSTVTYVCCFLPILAAAAVAVSLLEYMASCLRKEEFPVIPEKIPQAEIPTPTLSASRIKALAVSSSFGSSSKELLPLGVEPLSKHSNLID